MEDPERVVLNQRTMHSLNHRTEDNIAIENKQAGCQIPLGFPYQSPLAVKSKQVVIEQDLCMPLRQKRYLAHFRRETHDHASSF